MPIRRKQKIRGENNTGLYQVQPGLSNVVVPLAKIGSWLDRILAKTPPHVWLLSGPIGAGKTTLIQHLAARLGVSSEVTSPTFALQKIHPLRRQPWERLMHIDAYRIEGAHEIAALELDQYIADPATLLVVEWPERLPGIQWGPHLKITLGIRAAPGERSIRLEYLG